ncbi:MAG: hypothetical protein CVV44_07350 [Spirochaetae bacterium HGW-Spirochaetae-1]|nr:MAG: hypothetical protein CVV44_07350 [Spirochaetae bacterium HGW-Spirochaetae-1]
MKTLYTAAFIMITVLFALPLAAGGEDIMTCARLHYDNGEYYNAVTETMRYRFLYPDGKYVPAGMLLAGKAYFRGDNYSRSMELLDDCALRYGKTPEGEEALFVGAMARLKQGSPLFALSNFSKYMDVYGDSLYTEKVIFNRCYGAALLNDFEGSLQLVREYREKYPRGEYLEQAGMLEGDVVGEMNRPLKSPLGAVMGSMLVPGFGHFYTGNYRTGFFTLMTNAVFISLIVHGIMTGNIFQWMFFGFVELNFYQYSIIGAMRSVYEYNSRDDFQRRLRMKVSVDF